MRTGQEFQLKNGLHHISVQDLGSTNRTYALPIITEIESILQSAANYGTSTVHSAWGEDQYADLQSSSHIATETTLCIPGIIFLSKSFSIIIH